MKFRTELPAFSLPEKIQPGDAIFLAGSCFTEHMGTYLGEHGFHILQNPHGIIFNPLSVERCISDCTEARVYTENDFFQSAGIWHSWQHHSRFSATELSEAVQKVNNSIQEAHAFLREARWVVLTLGSSFVYHLAADDSAVANCHKMPAQTFYKKMLDPIAAAASLERTLNALRAFNPALKILLTVSPVRHAREGLVQNNRSKASLIYAVHTVCEQAAQVFYFPSFELVNDDLRDYRYFMEDMVHPNRQATEYVWLRFRESVLSERAQEMVKRVAPLQTAAAHKPFNPHSEDHARFLARNREQLAALLLDFPEVHLSAALQGIQS